MDKRKPVLIIHGGAGNIDPKRQKILHEELKRIYDLSFSYLLKNTALKAVVYAVSLLEDSPLFNAGTGSKLQQDGKIRMSVSVCC